MSAAWIPIRNKSLHLCNMRRPPSRHCLARSTASTVQPLYLLVFFRYPAPCSRSHTLDITNRPGQKYSVIFPPPLFDQLLTTMDVISSSHPPLTRHQDMSRVRKLSIGRFVLSHQGRDLKGYKSPPPRPPPPLFLFFVLMARHSSNKTKGTSEQPPVPVAPAGAVGTLTHSRPNARAPVSHEPKARPAARTKTKVGF